MASAGFQSPSSKNAGNSFEYICDSCSMDGKTSEALFFCPDCNDYMCSSCELFHKKVKVTRSHNPLSGDKMPKKAAKGITSPSETDNSFESQLTPAEDLSFWGNESTPAEEFTPSESISPPAEELSTVAEDFTSRKKKTRVRRVVLDATVTPHTTVNIKSPLDKYDPLITGLALLPNREMLLADYNNKCLKLLDKSQKIKDILDLPGIPYDVAVVNEKEAVVTLPLQQYVLQYVRLQPKLQTGRTIKLNKGCWGVEVANNNIYVACNNNTKQQEVVVLDTTGQYVSRIIEISKISTQFDNMRHIAVNPEGDKLYVTGTNQIMCMTVDGKVLYQCSGAKLGGPRGVVVDGEDNALVCCFDANKILTVKSDGTKYKTLLKPSDGIKDPKAKGYRARDGVLVVGGWKQSNLLVIFKLKGWWPKYFDSNKHQSITDNPVYTDTRYNDKIRYSDNLTVTKPLLKR